MNWFEEGLKEIGLTLKEYENMDKATKKAVDRLLKIMGHM